VDHYQGDRAKFEDIVRLLDIALESHEYGTTRPEKKRGDMQLGDIQNGLMQKTLMKA